LKREIARPHNRSFAIREPSIDQELDMTAHLKGCIAAAALVAFAGAIVAQTSALTRTMVTKADVSVPGREAVVARVEVAPGGVAGWHTHPGDEISYVMEGEATLMIAGQAPRKVGAGDGFVIPAGVVHNARNDSATAVKLVGVYVVEKGKPLASPASAPAGQ
jgi:quercetin dioxygenase-like cupin family protein